VDLFVTAIARVIQRHQAYPADSPLCAEAVTSCLRALTGLTDRGTITLRVQGGRLLADDEPVQTSQLVAADLARRFRRSGVASVTLDRDVTAREITRFCRELLRRDDREAVLDPLADVLMQYGVEHIQTAAAPRAEVLELGFPNPERLPLVEHQRARQEEAVASGPAVHLYPPDKGWVRVDPAAALREASLLDLVLLVEDPAALATMLVQLSEDGNTGNPADALADKVEEISGLIARLEPSLVEHMFKRLAQSVLALDEGRRQQLLRDTVLPGLLEGRADGSLLRHFPDLDLADSLSLLLDLQVAAPEMLRSAFERLELTPERQTRVKPLIDERVASWSRQVRSSDDLKPGEIDGLTEGGLKIDAEAGTSFSGFASYEVSFDTATRATIASSVVEASATPATVLKLQCARDILAVEPNPEVAGTLVTLAGGLLGELAAVRDWPTWARYVASLRALADAAHDERPEVAELVRALLGTLATPEVCAEMAALAGTSAEAVAESASVLAALGPDAGPAIVAALGHADERGRKALVKLAATNAAVLAPAIVPSLTTAEPVVVRHAVQIIGHGGAGMAAVLAPLISHGDTFVAREAFKGLSRIGTDDALAAVSSALMRGGAHHAQAEEAFWRFPAAAARDEAARLLADREFARRQPDTAAALLTRLGDADGARAATLARPLASLRFHFWNPSLMRLGKKATAVSRKS
jgi:hypothetical protein